MTTLKWLIALLAAKVALPKAVKTAEVVVTAKDLAVMTVRVVVVAVMTASADLLELLRAVKTVRGQPRMATSLLAAETAAGRTATLRSPLLLLEPNLATIRNRSELQ